MVWKKFEFVKSIDDAYDEVKVYCSEDAMVDWAIQYSNVAKVVRPSRIRRKIVEKAELLMECYKEE